MIFTLGAAAGNPWFKVTLREDLGPFKAGDKAWTRRNVEQKLKLGKTYWIFGPVSGKLMHIHENLGNLTLKGVLTPLKKGQGFATATESQSRVLDRELQKKLKKILPKQKQGQVDRLNA